MATMLFNQQFLSSFLAFSHCINNSMPRHFGKQMDNWNLFSMTSNGTMGLFLPVIPLSNTLLTKKKLSQVCGALFDITMTFKPESFFSLVAGDMSIKLTFQHEHSSLTYNPESKKKLNRIFIGKETQLHGTKSTILYATSFLSFFFLQQWEKS